MEQQFLGQHGQQPGQAGNVYSQQHAGISSVDHDEAVVDDTYFEISSTSEWT